MRLKAVQRYVEGEEMFLANYSDGLSDLPMPDVVDF
jgi:glucose-1-phosphate cytidylyltransferase